MQYERQFAGQGDYAELLELQDILEAQVQEMRQTGCQYAVNERDYRIALRKEYLMLRAEGKPATIIGDLARGNPDIAEMKMNRDSAKTLYEAAKEAINVTKLRLRIVNEQINREWTSGGSNVY